MKNKIHNILNKQGEKSLRSSRSKFTILSPEWERPLHTTAIPSPEWERPSQTTAIPSPEWEGSSQTTDYPQFN